MHHENLILAPILDRNLIASPFLSYNLANPPMVSGKVHPTLNTRLPQQLHPFSILEFLKIPAQAELPLLPNILLQLIPCFPSKSTNAFCHSISLMLFEG